MASASPGKAVQAKPASHGAISGRQHASPSPPQSGPGPGPGTALATNDQRSNTHTQRGPEHLVQAWRTAVQCRACHCCAPPVVCHQGCATMLQHVVLCVTKKTQLVISMLCGYRVRAPLVCCVCCQQKRTGAGSAADGVAAAVRAQSKFRLCWVRVAPGVGRRQTVLPLLFVPSSKPSSQAGSSAAPQRM